MHYKKTILIDLDGVLNTYIGDFDENKIPPIQQDAKNFILNLAKNFIVKIFTTRNKIQTAKWIIENGLEDIIQDITNIKEPCWLFVDDRCLKFNGDYSLLKKEIENFKPWYK